MNVFTARYELNVELPVRLIFVSKFRAMSQADSRMFHTVETQVRFQFNPCEVCVGQSGSEEGFSPSNSVLSCQYPSSITPYSSSSTCFSYQKDKRAKSENFAKDNALLEVGEHSIEMYIHYFFVLVV